MRHVRKSHVWLALALLPLLTAGRLVAQRPPPQPPPVPQPEKPKTGLLSYKPLKADPKDDELKKLQIARYNEAVAELQATGELVLRGARTTDALLGVASRLVNAGLEVYEKPEDHVKLLSDYLDLARDYEKLVETQHEGMKLHVSDLHQARYFRIDAEIQLLKAKRAAEKQKDK